MMKVGNIKSSGAFGGWYLVDALAEKLPQEVARGLSVAFSEREEELEPVWYIGYQLVNGLNHAFICRRIRKSENREVRDFVTVVINIPMGVNGYKDAKLVKMEVSGESILNEETQEIFDTAMKNMVGAAHKVLAEIGTQVVKGINYHFICQSQGVYPGSQPYLTRVIINQFGEYVSIVGIEPIAD